MGISVNTCGYIFTSAILLVSLSNAIFIGIEEMDDLKVDAILHLTSTAGFCFTVIKLTRNGFVRGVFTWFVNFELFLYLLFHLLMIVTVLSSNFKYKTINIVLVFTISLLTFGYIKCLTICYMKYRELLKIRRQARLAIIEANKPTPAGSRRMKGCFNIFLTDVRR